MTNTVTTLVKSFVTRAVGRPAHLTNKLVFPSVKKLNFIVDVFFDCVI